ncbi:MAG TPA: TerC family protein [Chitinophagales bacterium]|nr:TerC family protein [Chitinophagales bacterium]
MNDNSLLWLGFNAFVLLMLALDLGVFHRKSHVVGIKEALAWSGVWIALALVFNGLIYFGIVGGYEGAELQKQKGMEFLTGYLIEKSLSIDNIFVFLLIFTFFKVPQLYQHKVLFWGIIGALVMRAIFIFAGVALIEKFHWIIYVFGVFLIITGINMVRNKNKQLDPEKSLVIKGFRKIFPVHNSYDGSKFFVTLNGKRHATLLFVVLVFIEFTDLIFAVDSIPAILAITPDPFIVYTSNVFAILGLRSLYFALAGIMHRFAYLVYGLAAVLVFVGLKMVLVDVYKIPVQYSLLVIAILLAASIFYSIYNTRKMKT